MQKKTAEERKREFGRMTWASLMMCRPDLVERHVKHRLCHSTARNTEMALGTFIVSGHIALAHELASWAERLSRLSIEMDETPANWGHLSLNLLGWDRYEVLHGLSWMASGVSDESILAKAYDCAKAHVAELSHGFDGAYVEATVLSCCQLAATIGHSAEAHSMLDRLVRPEESIQRNIPEVLAECREFTRMIIRYLALEQEDDEMRLRVVAHLSEFFQTYTFESGLGDWRLPDAAWLAYVTAKYFPEFRQKDFTRPSVIGRLRFSSDDDNPREFAKYQWFG